MTVLTFEDYEVKHPEWKEVMNSLREMILSTGLEEGIKWGAPIYMNNGKNVVGIGAFKSHCALWFFQGSLLTENTELLDIAQDGKERGMRQIKFYQDDPVPLDVLKKYVLEAKQNQQAGKKIAIQQKTKLEVPEVLEKALKKDPIFEAAFNKLTPGRQREYSKYIGEAKQQPTKEKRLEKIKPMILNGAGLNDRYKT